MRRLKPRFGAIRRIGFGCIIGGRNRGSKRGERNRPRVKIVRFLNRLLLRAVREVREKTIQKRNLRLLQFQTSFRNREETDLVDFGEGLEFAGSDRPFGVEGVAGMRVAFGNAAFTRPGVNSLAPFLEDRAEVDEWSCQNESGFFTEFALGGGE